MTVYRCNVALTAFLMCGIGAISAVAVIWLVVRDFDLMGIMLMPVFVGVVLLLLRALLSRATIVVDDRQITAYMLGMRTKAIRWQDIKKIRKERVMNGYNYVDSFHVVDRMPRNRICRFLLANLYGDIVFTDEISELRCLLQQINSFARQHEIPLVVWDTEASGLLAELSG